MLGIRGLIKKMFNSRRLLRDRKLTKYQDPKNIMGPHEPLLTIDFRRNVTLLPLLDGDGPDQQRGGCLLNERLEVESARQLRARRVQRSTAAPICKWEIQAREPAKLLSGR